MISVDFSYLYQIYKFNKRHSVSSEEVEQYRTHFNKYYNRLKSRQQGFLDLGNQPKTLRVIQDFVEKHKNKFSYFVILGIGGSMLGPKTIVEALANEIQKSKVICLDNIDPYLINQTLTKIDLAKTLFLVQTKSGGTPETIAQYVFFKNKVEQQGLTWQNHFVFVTDPKIGWLRQIANEKNITTFEIPENVGGRFSVLTPVGLLISNLIDLDIAKMLDGANLVVQNQLQDAFDVAVSSFLLNQRGKTNLVIMPYNSRLKTFTEWCVQLVSESTGKQFDLDNQEVFAGLTPIPALGATDQHSQLQLFKEGPNDKQFIFIKTTDYLVTLDIPSEELALNNSLNYLVNQSFNSLIQAEFEGTRQSLTESLRPSITLTIHQTDESSLGALFMFFELYTAFLGEMLNINTFDQPGVERSKVLTKEILSKSKNF